MSVVISEITYKLKIAQGNTTVYIVNIQLSVYVVLLDIIYTLLEHIV
jgi:hypothetical protein